MPRAEAAFLDAAAVHDSAAARHDRAAELFDALGKPELASGERERARADREGGRRLIASGDGYATTGSLGNGANGIAQARLRPHRWRWLRFPRKPGPVASRARCPSESDGMSA